MYHCDNVLNIYVFIWLYCYFHVLNVKCVVAGVQQQVVGDTKAHRGRQSESRQARQRHLQRRLCAVPVPEGVRAHCHLHLSGLHAVRAHKQYRSTKTCQCEFISVFYLLTPFVILLRCAQVCVITGKPARYRDPRTGHPYFDLAAFKELRRRFDRGLIQ